MNLLFYLALFVTARSLRKLRTVFANDDSDFGSGSKIGVWVVNVRALAGGNQRVRIIEKTPELSSTMSPTLSE